MLEVILFWIGAVVVMAWSYCLSGLLDGDSMDKGKQRMEKHFEG